MKLLTEELLNRFKKVGSQEYIKDPIVVAKFFNPTGTGNWFATEYDPVEKTFFGYVSIFGTSDTDELGYFSLEELESYKGQLGLGIERDRYFEETKLSEIQAKYTK